MIVCIAEKKSVAESIAKVLGASAPRDGFFEGNGYQVTWALGHLCTLKEPHDYTEMWQRWSLGSLPMIPPKFGIKLMGERSKERQFNIIKKLIEGADSIINCGDAGQEGELIQRWIMQKAQAKCPVKRLWVSSLTEEAIKEGFATLKDQSEYKSLYEAGLCRAIGDWLLGMNATRLYTLKYAANKQVLSIGRVQTPTLALIVKRQNEIKNFVPKPYWELKTKYREVTFSVTEGKFEKKEKAEEALQKISGEPFTVTDVSAKKGNELPPRLYDLTSLQVDCNKKYGMTSDVTLQTIQSLYEKKYTTYPRVDTTYLSEDIYPKCENILKGMRDYASLIAPLMGKPLVKSKKVFDNKKVTDHHAIIPTGVHPQALTENEKRVYNLVATHFIAIFYPECKFCTTTVLGESGGVQFKATGKQITDPGWRVVFAGEPADSDKEEKNELMPAFVKGESGPHTPDLAEKMTQPPKPYTEATLLRAMETAGKSVEDEELRDLMKENGIGRPSTRAEIIKTLFKRNYIRNEKKNIIATDTGVELVSLIRNELLKSAELTGQWEKKLRDIERKNYEAKQFIAELKEMLIEVVNSVLRENSTIIR
ncbi:MAG: DNA topoisomerase III [Bacteroidales bacterium]|nr:DNA topoisomerase III [Bacteroidales bacterium]